MLNTLTLLDILNQNPLLLNQLMLSPFKWDIIDLLPYNDVLYIYNSVNTTNKLSIFMFTNTSVSLFLIYTKLQIQYILIDETFAKEYHANYKSNMDFNKFYHIAVAINDYQTYFKINVFNLINFIFTFRNIIYNNQFNLEFQDKICLYIMNYLQTDPNQELVLLLLKIIG